MTSNRVPPDAIPDWLLEAVRVMQEAGRMLGNIETELHYAMRLEGLDGRLFDDLQYVRDTLGAVRVSLTVMDNTAGRVLVELAEAETSGRLVDAAA